MIFGIPTTDTFVVKTRGAQSARELRATEAELGLPNGKGERGRGHAWASEVAPYTGCTSPPVRAPSLAAFRWARLLLTIIRSNN